MDFLSDVMACPVQIVVSITSFADVITRGLIGLPSKRRFTFLEIVGYQLKSGFLRPFYNVENLLFCGQVHPFPRNPSM